MTFHTKAMFFYTCTQQREEINMVHEVRNLSANTVKKDCFGGENTNTPKSEEVLLFDSTDLTPEEVTGTKIGNECWLGEATHVVQIPKKESTSLIADVAEIPHEIRLQAPAPKTASELVALNGGKMQKREVNGEKQQIAIIKTGKEEHKFLVNEDGTLGEQLVTLSTFGKNKYITQSEHNRRMNAIFPDGIPEGLDVNYAYQEGQYYPVFKKDGKALSSSDLHVMIAQQSAAKGTQDLAQSQ